MTSYWNDVFSVLGNAKHTPALYYFEEDILGSIKAFKDGLSERKGQSEIYYAVKSCYNPEVLKSIAKQGLGAEVMSALEYDLAIDAGFAPEDIILNGLHRGEELIHKAAALGTTIIVDSPKDLEHCKSFIENTPSHTLKIGVRLQVELSDYDDSPYSRTDHKLGVVFESELYNKILEFAQSENVSLDLLHAHVTINQDDSIIYVHTIDFLKKVLLSINSLGSGLSINRIDIGGGFGTFSRDQWKKIPEILNPIVTKFDQEFPGQTLVVEPGRALSNSSGYVVTTVLDIKSTGHENYAIVDAGMNVLIPIPDARYRLITDESKEGFEHTLHTISFCDRITSPAHVITKCDLPNIPSIGDKIVLGNCGAYTDVFATCWVYDVYPVYFVYSDGRVKATRSLNDAKLIRDLYLKSPDER